MMNYIKLLAIVGVCCSVVSCDNIKSKPTQKTVNNEKSVKPEDDWGVRRRIVSEINDQIRQNKFEVEQINYYTDSDKLKIVIFSKSGVPVKIKYPRFDITGQMSGFSGIYFNHKGVPIAISDDDSMPFRGQLLDIYTGNFLSFDGNSANPPFSDLNRQCEIVKTVGNLLSKSVNMFSYSDYECINSIEVPDIIVNADSIPLFRTSELNKSAIIQYLPLHSRLKYLKADNSQSNFETSNNYPVKIIDVSTKVVGWVRFGEYDLVDVSEMDE